MRYRIAAITSILALNFGIGSISAGHAQAAVTIPSPCTPKIYRVAEDAYVHPIPESTSKPRALVLEGEIISGCSDPVPNRFGVYFTQVWSNYLSGHFFSGYVETDSLKLSTR
ncbi:hypothetical protein ACFV16_34760 [Streptomyces massasporeus]|uniref:hypothetical protein n=1 Tax=Streptomyces massasporeus TaxID=67324 RepID=UPI0036C7100A